MGLTLRDARRLVVFEALDYHRRHFRLRGVPGTAPLPPWLRGRNQCEMLRALDREITQRGPLAPLEEVPSTKAGSRSSAQSGSGSLQGEPSATSERGRDAAGSTAPRTIHGSKSETRPTRDEDEPTDRAAPGAHLEPSDTERAPCQEPTPCFPGKALTGGRDHESATGDEDTPASERAVGDSSLTTREDSDTAGVSSSRCAAGGEHSWSPRRAWGGDTADPSAVAAVLQRYRRDPAVLVCASLMERLLRPRLVGLGQNPSPRVDARRLVEELCARSVRRSRWQREELTRPVVIIAADTSGSCSVCSTQMWAAALVLAERLDGVVAVQHSNGCPGVVYGPSVGVRGAADADGQGWWIERPEWWQSLMARYHVAGALWLGDFDGFWVVEAIRSTGSPVWHLDSYCCREGTVRAPRMHQPPRSRGVYVQGVSTLQDVGAALRIILATTPVAGYATFPTTERRRLLHAHP